MQHIKNSIPQIVKRMMAPPMMAHLPGLSLTIRKTQRGFNNGSTKPMILASKGRTAIGSASEGKLGGMRALMALRQILTLGCGATVVPGQFALSAAGQAFDEDGQLKDTRDVGGLRSVVRQLIDVAQQMM